MRFVLEIKCDNTAFHADDDGMLDDEVCATEVARLLHLCADKLDRGYLLGSLANAGFPLMDTNGNKVGLASFVEDGNE